LPTPYDRSQPGLITHDKSQLHLVPLRKIKDCLLLFTVKAVKLTSLLASLTPQRTAAKLPLASPGMTLFCDFDGPIVDVSGRYYSTYRLALSRTRRSHRQQGNLLQLTPMSKAQFWHMKQVRIPDPEIALRSGLRGQQIDDFLSQVKEIVNCCPGLLRRDRLQPQVPAALKLLKTSGVKPILVTLRCESQVKAFLERYGLQTAFAGIYGTQDAHAAYANYTDLKTSLLSQALGDHGNAETDWMVGDTEADVIAAQRLELPAIALSCGIRSHGYLSNLKPTSLQPNLLTVAQRIHHSLAA